MTKPKENHIRDCINCHTDKNVKAEDKVESRSFNGWSRKMFCSSCMLTWKQLFYRGNFQMEGM